jgi:hypothetical protein
MHPNPDIAATRTEMLDEMVGFMERCAEDKDSPAPYTQADVDACAAVVDSYVAALEALPKPAAAAAIMNQVERAVLALNAINERCDGLIETGQREQLCDIFIMAARDAGLQADEDITDEWRDW